MVTITAQQKQRLAACGCAVIERDAPDVESGCCHWEHEGAVEIPSGVTDEEVEHITRHVEALHNGTKPPDPEDYCALVAESIGGKGNAAKILEAATAATGRDCDVLIKWRKNPDRQPKAVKGLRKK